MNLSPQKAIFLFVGNGVLPPTGTTLFSAGFHRLLCAVYFCFFNVVFCERSCVDVANLRSIQRRGRILVHYVFGRKHVWWFELSNNGNIENTTNYVPQHAQWNTTVKNMLKKIHFFFQNNKTTATWVDHARNGTAFASTRDGEANSDIPPPSVRRQT